MSILRPLWKRAMINLGSSLIPTLNMINSIFCLYSFTLLYLYWRRWSFFVVRSNISPPKGRPQLIPIFNLKVMINSKVSNKGFPPSHGWTLKTQGRVTLFSWSIL